jgi:hypothetical protein
MMSQSEIQSMLFRITSPRYDNKLIVIDSGLKSFFTVFKEYSAIHVNILRNILNKMYKINCRRKI